MFATQVRREEEGKKVKLELQKQLSHNEKLCFRINKF